MKKIIFIISLIPLFWWIPAGAKVLTFEQLRAMADKGSPQVVDVMFSNRVPLDGSHLRLVTKIEDKLYLDGLVAGCPVYPRHANLEMPYNENSYSVNVNTSMSACYLQSEDGRYGVKVMFPDERSAGTLKPFGKAEINLKGLTLVKEGNCYILMGCTPAHVVYCDPGVVEDMPVKEKYISELSDEDLYTFVTLKDCEFVFKNGGFGTTIEQALVRSAAGRNQGTGRADGWQRLIMDSKGDMTYFHVNTKMTNRRIGGGVPRGTGKLRGIIVDTYNPRFGATCSKYGIRPHSNLDVLMDWVGEPGYRTLAAWDWNTNPSGGLIPAEYGSGVMATDCPDAKVSRVDDWDNPRIELKGEKLANPRGLLGAVTNGAIQIEARTCDWWDWEKDTGRGLLLICSTIAAKGYDMFLAFTSCGGNRSTATTYGYPSFWKVQYSLDGVNFTDAPAPEINMKTLWHNNSAMQDGEYYEHSYEMALGFSEHLVHLPASLLGQKRVYLKITPARKVVASLGYMVRDNITLRPNMTDPCFVNFGEIIIGYR